MREYAHQKILGERGGRERRKGRGKGRKGKEGRERKEGKGGREGERGGRERKEGKGRDDTFAK